MAVAKTDNVADSDSELLMENEIEFVPLKVPVKLGDLLRAKALDRESLTVELCVAELLEDGVEIPVEVVLVVAVLE